jgi:hypothetical protein
MPLKAIALSIKPGGSIDRVGIGGRMRTSGENVVTLEVEGGLGEIDVAGGITADGRGSDAVRTSHEISGLDKLKIHATPRTSPDGVGIARLRKATKSVRIRRFHGRGRTRTCPASGDCCLRRFAPVYAPSPT